MKPKLQNAVVKDFRSVSLCCQSSKLRRWCHWPQPPEAQCKKHPDALTHGGSVSTVATFTSQVHIYGSVPCSLYELTELNRRAALFQRRVKSSLSNYRSPSRDLGVEQNKCASLKVGSGVWRQAKPITLSTRWTYYTRHVQTTAQGPYSAR